MPDTNLAGLTIAVTRARHQAGSLMAAIEAAGGKAFAFPLLDIIPLKNEQLTSQIRQLPTFDFAIFVSPNAVLYGLQAIRELISLPPALRLASVGGGSQRALVQQGICNSLCPTSSFDSEGLLALPELQQLNGKKVMIFRGDGGRELMGQTLQQRGAQVEYACCYLRQKPQHNIATLQAAGVNAITITSSEALGHLSQLKGAENLFQLPLFCIHPRISALAQELGWQTVITTETGDTGLLNALNQWAQHTRN